MTEAIHDPDYWKRRIAIALDREQAHLAIYEGSWEQWCIIRARHQNIISRVIKRDDTVLDAGCGWGRAWALTPGAWRARHNYYLGLDISPELIGMARLVRPKLKYEVHDLRQPIPAEWLPAPDRFSLCIAQGLRGMIQKHLGDSTWAEVEANLRAAAERILYLEFNETYKEGVE